MNVYRYVLNNPMNLIDPTGFARVPPNRARTRKCRPSEIAACKQMCGARGMQSCKVSQTWRIKRIKNGLAVYGWHDGPMSCSCNDPEDFCGRNPAACAVGVGIGICILIATPWPDDVFIPLLLSSGAAVAVTQ